MHFRTLFESADAKTLRRLAKTFLDNAHAPSLDLAERGFDIFLTIDRKLEHLIDLSKSALGFVMVRVASNTLEAYRPNFDRLLAVETVRKREVIHLDTRLGQ